MNRRGVEVKVKVKGFKGQFVTRRAARSAARMAAALLLARTQKAPQ